MTFELLKDLAKLALIAGIVYVALRVVVEEAWPGWVGFLENRRFGLLLSLVLAVTAIKLIEDVVTGESGPADERILRFVHDVVPDAMHELFALATRTGSASFLIPMTMLFSATLFFRRRRFEAVLVAVSVTSAALVVYVLKALVNRSRPALWETQWYWGSSFPSGHTLVVAAFAVAAAIVAIRIWPQRRIAAMSIAGAWILLVAMSRLVLGVHWPTDVLAAACSGGFIPVAAGIALDAWRSRQSARRLRNRTRCG